MLFIKQAAVFKPPLIGCNPPLRQNNTPSKLAVFSFPLVRRVVALYLIFLYTSGQFGPKCCSLHKKSQQFAIHYKLLALRLSALSSLRLSVWLCDNWNIKLFYTDKYFLFAFWTEQRKVFKYRILSHLYPSFIFTNRTKQPFCFQQHITSFVTVPAIVGLLIVSNILWGFFLCHLTICYLFFTILFNKL